MLSTPIILYNVIKDVEWRVVVIEHKKGISTSWRVILVMAVAIAMAFLSACTGTGAPDSNDGDEKNPTPTKNFKIGKTIRIGGAKYDDKEIDWIVLHIEDNKALLISKYVITARAYNDLTASQAAILERGDYSLNTKAFETDWENSSLRRWLNDDFLAGFDKRVIDKIVLTEVTNNESPMYHTKGSPNTLDKVFLLSTDETALYFKKDMGKQQLKGIRPMPNGEKESRWWWLRTTGAPRTNATMVHGDGSVNLRGSTTGVRRGGVRPAIWYEIDE